MIYVNANNKEQKLIYSGITFSDFMEYSQAFIKNIILLKGNFLGNKHLKNFEVMEGEEYIANLKKEDIYSYGDFCFVDYSLSDCIYQLTNEQVAELLFMAHMYKPLKSPFFKVLSNQFAYLAHDDGYICILYLQNMESFLGVLNSKIISAIKHITKREVKSFDISILKDLMELAEEGLLIDLNEIKKKGNISVNAYVVGEYSDMNKVFLEKNKLKENAQTKKKLIYTNGKWNEEVF